jgi:hypothetical protein
MQRFLLSRSVYFGLAAVLLLPVANWAQLSDFSDAEIEQCLSEGKVGKKAGKLVGVTRPEHVKIDCPGIADSAVFKYHDEHRQGITRLASGETELNFSDSYKYDRAAYLLDRQLGMNMVPVAVIRTVKGDEGALVAWLPNAVHEAEMEGSPKGLEMVGLLQDKAVMRLFDALIYNVDRRPENWMVDQDDWSLYLIDHTRAFRDLEELPESFTSEKAWLSQDLYAKLQALDEAELIASMEGLISDAQIRSMLARRDLILEKIEQDREAQGDDAVFFK